MTLKSRAQIERMAVAGRLVGDVLDAVGAAIRPGVTPLELDALAEDVIRSRGGIPSFIGVPGHLAPFEHTLCISIDDEVVHGIPDRRRIREGQLVSVDAGAIVDGWHGDSARTWVVGDAGPKATASWSSDPRGDAGGHRGGGARQHLGDIARGHRGRRRSRTATAIVRAFVGHGIGTEMHEEPQVTNYRTGRTGPAASSPGCASRSSRCSRWAATRSACAPTAGPSRRRDGSLAAHWEHTIADDRGRARASSRSVPTRWSTWPCRRSRASREAAIDEAPHGRSHACERAPRFWYTPRSCVGVVPGASHRPARPSVAKPDRTHRHDEME